MYAKKTLWKTILCSTLLATTLFFQFPAQNASANLRSSTDVIPTSGYYFASAYGTQYKEKAAAVKELRDGNLAIVGSKGASNYTTVTKTSQFGSVLWSKSLDYTSEFSVIEETYSRAVPTSTSSSIVVSGSNGTGLFITLLTQNGELLWTQNYSPTGIRYTSVRSILQASDGGFLVTATVEKDVPYPSLKAFVMKTDSSGNLTWSKIISSDTSMYTSAAQETSSGDFILAGATIFTPGPNVIVVFKITSSGNLAWIKAADLNLTFVEDMKLTGDGKILLVGRYQTKSLVVSLDGNGNVEWSKTTGDGIGDNIIRSVELANDGGFVMTGITMDYPNVDVIVGKVDSNGEGEWFKQIEGGAREETYSIARSGDGYVIAGVTESLGFGNEDMFITKVDQNGTLISCPLFQDLTPSMDNFALTFSASSWTFDDLSTTQTTDSPTLSDFAIQRETVCRVCMIHE